MMNKPRGRPRGDSGAKERILFEARASFLQRGYRATTMRVVAAAADVDLALISYHFGSKQGLFGAATALGITPGQVVAQVLECAPDRLPQELLRAVLRVWDDPEAGGPLTLLVTQAEQDLALRRALQEYVERELTGRLAAHIGGRDSTERAGSALTMILGVIFSRYVFKINPIAAMDPEQLVHLLAPGLAAILHRAGPIRRHG
ncbi:TetR family transcriptional regulator [Streptomyces sp. NPDC048404]|uniref:TetR/AcrR family transcriptional regulator n=1 Tax=unclassified Streptomyces TaxID=2593676 RepID=UPI0034357F41